MHWQSRHTRVAFSDESSYNVGRFRSLAVVTVGRTDSDVLSRQVAALLRESGVAEVKWSEVRGARERLAAAKLLLWAVDRACKGRLTLDTLVWDTHDDRHRVVGRDDIANLHRMYFRILNSVLTRPSSRGAVWLLKPDSNSAIDWDSVHDVLHNAALRPTEADLLSSLRLWKRASRRFFVETIQESDSRQTPLVQLADVTAGLAIYSHDRFDAYDSWCHSEAATRQSSLDFAVSKSVTLSGADVERCRLLKTFDEHCKLRRLGVSLHSHRGLTSYPPDRGVRFWLYRRQRPTDLAPIRAKRIAF